MTYAFEPSSLLAIGAPFLVVALLAGWLLRRRAQKPGVGQRRGTAAIPVAAVAAIGCTAYSADTSWRFAADYLDMGSTVERAFMFATAELALFAMALMARQNLKGPRQAPGPPGVLVWVITGGQIIPAYAESGPVGGTVRALIGPVMAAVLWHLAMGIELRNHTPEAASRSLLAILGRQARERLLARLGIHDQDADAARLIRERALSRAVTLILRIEAMPETKRWRGPTSTVIFARTSCCCGSSGPDSRPPGWPRSRCPNGGRRPETESVSPALPRRSGQGPSARRPYRIRATKAYTGRTARNPSSALNPLLIQVRR